MSEPSSTPTTVQWLRAAGARVYTGSGRLTTHGARRVLAVARRLYERIRAWLSESSGLSWCLKIAALLAAAALARAIGVAVLGGIYVRIESGAWSRALWAAAVLWLIAAYRVGRPDWTPKERLTPTDDASTEADPKETQEQAEAAPHRQPGPLPVSPTALVAAVRDIGTPHAQLKPLAAHLGTTTDTVRAAAAELGWPVKDVRMDGRSASAGLRWDEGPALPLPAPSPTVVGAGERADDNDDDKPGEGPREGSRVQHIGHGGRIVADLAEAFRHHRIKK